MKRATIIAGEARVDAFNLKPIDRSRNGAPCASPDGAICRERVIRANVP